MQIVLRLFFSFLISLGALWLLNNVLHDFSLLPDPLIWVMLAGALAVTNVVLWPLFKMALSPVLVLLLAVAALVLLGEAINVFFLAGVVAFVLVVFFLRVILLNLGAGILLVNAVTLLLAQEVMSGIAITGLSTLFYATLVLGIANGLVVMIVKQLQ